MSEYNDKSFTEKDMHLFDDAQESEFENCNFTGLEFVELSFKSSFFLECVFENCSFSEVDLLNTTFRDARFINCRLMGIMWTDVKTLSHPEFINCKLDYSSFQGMDLRKTSFVGCSAKDADFSSMNLSEANFAEAMLLNATFNNSDLRKSNLLGATRYLIDPQFTKLKGAKVDFPEAASLLTEMGLEVVFN